MSDVDGEIPENNGGVEAEAVHDWSAFYDDDGRLYYYNSVSGESSWDPPERFNPVPEGLSEHAAADTTTAATLAETSVISGSSTKAWVVYQDDEGR